MQDIEITAPIRKVMTLFLLVDTSGSMIGDKIQAVKSAIEEVKVQLADLSKKNDDAEIRFAVMSFGKEVNWLTPKPAAPESIDVSGIIAVEKALTPMGAACAELESKLSRSEFLEDVGNYPPVTILLSDGFPTDNFTSGLNTLKQNNWFKRAIKVAFAIGAEADRDILTQFTGSSETVIGVNDAATLKALLEKVSVITSDFQSKPKETKDAKDAKDAEDPTADAEKLVQQAIENVDVDTEKIAVGDNPVKMPEGWGIWK